MTKERAREFQTRDEWSAYLHEELRKPFPTGVLQWRAAAKPRGGQGGQGQVEVVSYLDARYIQGRFDEVVGPGNWQIDYKEIAGAIFAGIGILCPIDGRVTWKWDTGHVTQNEKEKARQDFGAKGSATDGEKRAAVQWGVGRYVYGLGRPTMPCSISQRGNPYNIQKPGYKHLPWWAVPIEEALTWEEANPGKKYNPNDQSLIDEHPGIETPEKEDDEEKSTPAGNGSQVAEPSRMEPAATRDERKITTSSKRGGMKEKEPGKDGTDPRPAKQREEAKSFAEMVEDSRSPVHKRVYRNDGTSHSEFWSYVWGTWVNAMMFRRETKEQKQAIFDTIEIHLEKAGAYGAAMELLQAQLAEKERGTE